MPRGRANRRASQTKTSRFKTWRFSTVFLLTLNLCCYAANLPPLSVDSQCQSWPCIDASAIRRYRLCEVKRHIENGTWERVAMAHARGVSLRNAARIFNLPEGTVLSHYSRTRQRTRKAASGFTKALRPPPAFPPATLPSPAQSSQSGKPSSASLQPIVLQQAVSPHSAPQRPCHWGQWRRVGRL